MPGLPGEKTPEELTPFPFQTPPAGLAESENDPVASHTAVSLCAVTVGPGEMDKITPEETTEVGLAQFALEIRVAVTVEGWVRVKV